MRKLWLPAVATMFALLAGCASGPAPGRATSSATTAELREQVRATEAAFARTMADRDHAAFTSFLSEEAVFFGRTVQHGKREVADAWARFFSGREAPFSWAPEEVEVLPSGTLALSSGPVHDPQGKPVGRFMSIWRQEAPGRWRIVFDKGCNCPQQ
jgi:ketosteroid isomerase-like protein